MFAVSRMFILLSLLIGFQLDSAHAALSALRTSFSVPASNVAFSSPVLDDRHIVYGIATPRYHLPTCVSCGQPAFTDFRVHIYIRDYHQNASSIALSPARTLFIGSRGAQIILYALAGG